MSADNGIYILKTRDQYRVAHLQAIENVYWSVIDGEWQGKCVPTRVVEMWGNCKFTRDANKALDIAYRWATKLPICEYGVKVITYNKTWKRILEDAQEYAKQEISFIKNQHKEKLYEYEMNKLQNIADGYYLPKKKMNKGMFQFDFEF